MTKSLRIAFMGTPDFAATALKALLQSDHQVICVYSQPPRPKGRGHKVQLSATHAVAEMHNIPVYTPLNFKDPATVEEFRAHNLDIAVVAAYGLILPQAVLDAPRFGCVNIHASLLPRWRGASPIQHAIWHGDDATGIGIMQMEAGLDTGPVIAEQSLPITAQTTAPQLHDALAALGAEMILQTIDALATTQNPLPTAPQQGETTYAPLLSKADGRINWSQTAKQIDRQIRALNPWPSVWTMAGDKRLKIQTAAPQAQTTDQPAGTLLDTSGLIACGQGTVLHIQTLQPEGKNAMTAQSAVNGGYLEVGQCLT